MLTTLRPYTKVVSVTQGTHAVIDLKDSAGNSLDCNYITVDASGAGGAAADFFVYLSSVPGLTTPATPTTPVLATVSGFCGIMGVAPGVKPVELFLDYEDKVNKITVYCESSLDVVVTYGNIHVANALRFNDMTKGS